jgi:adenosylmethionine-8-amino-7-oxononanoate aminotransferase
MTQLHNSDKISPIGNSIDKRNSLFKTMPVSSVLHRSLHSEPLIITSTKGQYLTLSSGRQVFDACGGAAVSCIGHCDPRVVSAITKQLETVDYVYSGHYTTESVENLSKLVLRDQSALTHVLIVSSGSEAMESTLKLCRQYWVEVDGNDTPRTQFISRKQSYHGATLGALSVGGHIRRRSFFEPILEQRNVHQISPCYAYRDQVGSEEEYTNNLIQELVAKIEEIGPEKVAAFIFEPVVGAALACVPATSGYMVKVRDVCDRYGILMVCDEVMCGMGRCSDGQSLHAWRSLNPGIPEERIAPDIQTCGKGLGGGYVPIAAVLTHHKISKALSSGSGMFMNGFTYQAHPVSCAAAVAVQQIIIDDGLLSRGSRLGKLLEQRLKAEILPLAHVGDVRGAGLFWGVEFVRDKQTKAPFEKPGTAQAVHDLAFERGVQVYVSGGVADGTLGDAVIFAPAYNCSDDDIEMMVRIVANAIRDAFP